MIGNCYKYYWLAVFAFVLGIVGFLMLALTTLCLGYVDIALFMCLGVGFYLLICMHIFSYFETTATDEAHRKAVQYYNDWIHQ